MKVTLDDIAAMLARTPPREVPAHLERAANRGNRLLGWILIGPTLLLCWAFSPAVLLNYCRFEFGQSEFHATEGEVTRVLPSDGKINGRNRIPYAFTYAGPDGRKYEGLCFALDANWHEGTKVTVRYRSANPEVACPDGASLGSTEWIVCLLAVVFAGGTTYAWGIVPRRNRRLLREGRMTEAKVVSVDETSWQAGEQTLLYSIVIAAPTLSDGRPITLKFQHRRAARVAADRLERKQPLYVLYDPQKSSRVVLPETWIDD